MRPRFGGLSLCEMAVTVAWLRNFVIKGAKRLLQHHRPTTDSCTAASMPAYWDRYDEFSPAVGAGPVAKGLWC